MPTPSGVIAPYGLLEHAALLYRDERDYLDAAVAFIEGGLNRGESVLVAVPTINLELLRVALGRRAPRVEMHDMTVIGGNPGRIIGDLLLDFAARHSEASTRTLAEPTWFGRDPIEYPACAQHEALINVACAGLRATIACAYHVAKLDGHMISDAARTHPVLWTGAATWPSPHYTDPEVTAASFNLPFPPVPRAAAEMTIRPGSTGASRRFTASFGLSVGLPLDRVADAVLVIDELVNNTEMHGGGYGRLAAWADDRRAIFEVSDGGYIKDSLAGRRRVNQDEPAGHGLALAHRQCDLMRTHTSPAGTTTRVYFELALRRTRPSSLRTMS